MVPAVFSAIGVEAEFFEAIIFVLFEIFGIVEPPMDTIEELGNGDGSKAGVIVLELRFFVIGDGVAGFEKPFSWGQIEGANGFKFIGCEGKDSVPDFGRTGSERDEQKRRTANPFALVHARNAVPALRWGVKSI
jgi:hypothetical protein